jgi:hypothetical protein
MPPSFDTVRKIGLALPDVETGTSYGSPALKVRGRMFVCMASHRSAEPNSLVIRMDFGDRDALIAEAPAIYYLTPHYVGYPCVVARLAKVPADVLPELVRMAWRFITSRDAPIRPRRVVARSRFVPAPKAAGHAARRRRRPIR